MAKYSMRVRLADITICFESDQESDISDLSSFFKYHLADSEEETDCTVVLKRQASFHMPKDAEMLWLSKSQGIQEPEKLVGKQRIKIYSNFDTFGLATCYISRERGEYYYGLMQDQSWISCRPAEHKIKYVLHRPPKRKGIPDESEGISPLSAIPLLIHVISTICGRYLIHGAAVGIDGRASLFLGKNGSGKSTLCTDLARQKATFMGDDIVLLYTENGVPMVGALLFPAKLYLDNSEEKSEVDVPEQMQTDYCLSAPLEAVYSVQLSGKPTSTVEPRVAAELLPQLMGASNGMMMQYDKQQWLSTMYEISEQVPYFFLHFGDRSSMNLSLLNTNS